MLSFTCRRHVLLASLLVLAAAVSTEAQSDPPDRVARLNYLSGQVSFRPASLEDWGAATINYPLTTGDHLWTESGASAEMHVGSSVIRLAPETAFSFLNLDSGIVQTRLAEGALDLRVREIDSGETYEIDTPNVAISVLRPGIYHVEVDPDGDRTRVTVREGEVQVDGNGRSFSVYPDQMAEIVGVEDVVYDVGRAPRPDRWEMWCRDRDRREDNRLALTYVSRDMIGYEDLDDYGTWTYVPDYGYGWEPTVVAVDWAPYRYGRWAWVRPWGWTWVDDARWGFAPSHYGRWVCYRSRWVWLPGHRSPRPVWAPALVAFVGGRDWNFSFGFGVRPAVAWFPLGPGEFYCPPYRSSPRYLRNLNARNVNITNINVTNINVTNVRYTNRDVPGAMTAVPRDMFVASQPVQRVGKAVPRDWADRGQVVAHSAAVNPDTTSVIGRIPPNAARPPQAAMRRAVVARSQPPAAATESAPVESLSRRPRPGAGWPANAAPQPSAAANDRASQGSAAPRASDDDRTVQPAPGDRSTPARESAGARGARDTTTYSWPQNQGQSRAQSDRPAAASARPRGEQPGQDANWRPASGRPTEVSEQPPAAPQTGTSERARPRTDYQAPRYEPPRYEAPSYQAPRYQSAPRPQTSERNEPPARYSERPAPREDRTAPVHESPGPDRSAARPRDDRPQDRPASSGGTHVDRPASAPAPQASRPAERPAERAQPKSGGQSEQKSGGQSGGQSGSARPRGGRGGQQ